MYGCTFYIYESACFLYNRRNKNYIHMSLVIIYIKPSIVSATRITRLTSKKNKEEIKKTNKGALGTCRARSLVSKPSDKTIGYESLETRRLCRGS